MENCGEDSKWAEGGGGEGGFGGRGRGTAANSRKRTGTDKEDLGTKAGRGGGGGSVPTSDEGDPLNSSGTNLSVVETRWGLSFSVSFLKLCCCCTSGRFNTPPHGSGQ